MDLGNITRYIFETRANSLNTVEFSRRRKVSPHATRRELIKDALKWRDYIVLCGLARYSLEREPAFLVAKFGARFRTSLSKEISEDTKGMISSWATPEDEGRAYFVGVEDMRGLRLSFPNRLYSCFFVTDVKCPEHLADGEVPTRKEMSLLVKEVDELAEIEYAEKIEMFSLGKGQRREDIRIWPVTQGYLFFSAKEGMLKTCSFDSLRRYNSNQLKSYGEVSLVQDDVSDNWIEWLLPDKRGLRLAIAGSGLLKKIVDK